MSAIGVVIAEDQTMVLGALAALLEMDGDIRVLAQAGNGKQALASVLQETPDVLITDIEMPEMTGLELAAEVQSRGLRTRVIILTTFARAGYLRRAMDAGARGYILKDRPAKELADAVRRVHNGLRVVDPELAAEAWGDPDPLTDRERQVLRLAGEGRRPAISRQSCAYLKVRCEIIFRKRSANWELGIVSKRHASRAAMDGCEPLKQMP